MLQAMASKPLSTCHVVSTSVQSIGVCCLVGRCSNLQQAILSAQPVLMLPCCCSLCRPPTGLAVCRGQSWVTAPPWSGLMSPRASIMSLLTRPAKAPSQQMLTPQRTKPYGCVATAREMTVCQQMEASWQPRLRGQCGPADLCCGLAGLVQHGALGRAVTVQQLFAVFFALYCCLLLQENVERLVRAGTTSTACCHHLNCAVLCCRPIPGPAW
jgi:hypothetical protein